jgi:hypothetical protein
MKRLLLACVLAGSCAHPVPVVTPDEPTQEQYIVPWDAKDSDLVCADTRPGVPSRFCMTVRRFRQFTIDPKA